MTKKKSTNHYVDNRKLYGEMIKYHTAYTEAKANGTELPKISNYIGQCIWLIATNISNNYNFRNYSYRDEMESDGIENCIRYLHNFNPEKSNNPFAYFSQIIYYAFIRRIEREHKQAYVRAKALEQMMIQNTLVDLAPDDESHFQMVVTSMMDADKFEALVQKFEKKTEKKAPTKKGLEKFLGDEDEQD